VRFVSSGTEAAMSALRVARAATKRDKIIKFEGCYHGHADPFLVQAGSGAMTLGVPTSPGVPAVVAADTLLARYNDLRSVEAVCDAHRGQIAEALAHLEKIVVEGVRHGFFECSIACVIGNGGKRQLVIRAGKSHKFTIPEEELSR